MYIIGLTGGIGCGKTTVSELFKKQGVTIIDADDISRTLVQPNTPLLSAIIKQFGSSVVHNNGTLNRDKLRDKVFEKPAERKKLEALTHPAILAEMLKLAQHANSPYCIFSIPLLFETGQEKYVDRTLVIDTPVQLQRSRVSKRSGLSQQQITQILNAQTSRENRLARADDIIDNSHSRETLPPQVIELHEKYLKLANA